MFYIYKITNLINNKTYIGQTNNFNRRWKDHCKYNDQRVITIDRAIKKYGKDNFKYELLETCDTLCEANIQESWNILIYNSLYPVGYNISPGGR